MAKITMKDYVDAANSVPTNIADNMAPRKFAQWLPTVGYFAGNALLPEAGGLGGVAGAGLGQIGARLGGLYYGDINPADAQNPSKEAAIASGMAASGAIDIPLTGKASPAIAEFAAEMGETKLANWLGQGKPSFVSRVTVGDKTTQQNQQ